MPRVPDLIGRLRLDTRDLDRAKGEVTRFGRDVQGIGGQIRTGLGSGLDSATSALTAGLGPAGIQAKATLDRLGTSALSSGSALQFGLGAAAVGTGLLVTKFATDGVAAFVSLAGEVRNFQRASGASAEDSSRFVAVLDDLQISSQTGASAIFKLGREISAGAPKLREFGIEVARNRDGTANFTETLLNVSDAYSRAPDQATKTAIAFAAFGKQAISLIPLLEKGRIGLDEFFAGAEEHGQILTDEDIQSARDLELALDDLHDAMRGLQIAGAKALVPFLTKVSEVSSKTLGFLENINSATGGLLPKIAGLALKGALGPLGAGFDAVASIAKDSADSTVESAGEMKAGAEAAGEGLSDLNAALIESSGVAVLWESANKRTVDTFKAVVDAYRGRLDATLSLADAEGASRRSSVSLADALSDVADKERDLETARRGRIATARDALSAERALNSVEDATSSVVDKEHALADAREGRGPKARELADAERDLAKARQDVGAARGVSAVADAQERVAEAEDRLRRARRDGGQEADITDATETLSRAQLDAREATLNLSEAQTRAAEEQRGAEAALVLARENALSAALGSARAARELAELQAEAAGRTLTASEGYTVFRDRLVAIRDSLPPLSEVRGAIDGVLASIMALPDVKPINVTADTTNAVAKLGELKSLVDSIKDSTLNVLASLPNATTVPQLFARPVATTATAAPSTVTAGTTVYQTNNISGVREQEVTDEVNRAAARLAARAR